LRRIMKSPTRSLIIRKLPRGLFNARDLTVTSELAELDAREAEGPHVAATTTRDGAAVLNTDRGSVLRKLLEAFIIAGSLKGSTLGSVLRHELSSLGVSGDLRGLSHNKKAAFRVEIYYISLLGVSNGGVITPVLGLLSRLIYRLFVL